jgi:hypothetical protein
MKKMIKLVFIVPRRQVEALTFIYDKPYEEINADPFRKYRDELIEEGELKQEGDRERNKKYRTLPERYEMVCLPAIRASKYTFRNAKGKMVLSQQGQDKTVNEIFENGKERLVSHFIESMRVEKFMEAMEETS